jgi:uncharacterized protein YebE (UPF0316 family)
VILTPWVTGEIVHMATVFQVIIYLLIGFVEMFLATARTSFISRGKTIQAATIVFFENIIYFAIIYQLVNNVQNGWPVFIAYSTGGSLGTFVHLKKFTS